MRVAIGPLARAGLESRSGGDLTASVRRALLYYVRKLEAGRSPAKYPDFIRPRLGSSDDEDNGDSVEIEVELDRKLEAELEREAADQHTTMLDLARHAVLLYLAEIDLVAGKREAAQERSRTLNGEQD
jgi:hypothetical protein